MAQMNVTDINDGTIFFVQKTLVNSIYELDIYRQIVMISGEIYDVAETFAHLSGELGNQGGGGGNV
jgi:hypothetical protein